MTATQVGSQRVDQSTNTDGLRYGSSVSYTLVVWFQVKQALGLIGVWRRFRFKISD